MEAEVGDLISGLPSKEHAAAAGTVGSRRVAFGCDPVQVGVSGRCVAEANGYIADGWRYRGIGRGQISLVLQIAIVVELRDRCAAGGKEGRGGAVRTDEVERARCIVAGCHLETEA